MKLQNIDTFHHFGLVGMKAMLRSRDSNSSYLLGFLLYLQGCIQRPRKNRLTMAGVYLAKNNVLNICTHANKDFIPLLLRAVHKLCRLKISDF